MPSKTFLHGAPTYTKVVALFSIFVSSPDYLSNDDLFDVLSDLEPAKAHWYNLGVGLKVRKGDLEAIKMDSRSSLDGLREMLEIWLDQVSPRPTWQTVIRVLRSPVVGKQNTLASELEEKYCTSSRTKITTTSAANDRGDQELSEWNCTESFFLFFFHTGC